MMTTDEMVAALQRQTGCTAEYARRICEQNAQLHATGTAIAAHPAFGAFAADRPISEAEEQRRIRRSAIERGAKVYWLSQARKTGQTPGIPDLWLAFPSFGMWWETKAQDGVLSPFQEDFRDECRRNGTRWGCGTHADFLAYCDAHAIPGAP